MVKPIGRPSKLTRAVGRQIGEKVALGMPFKYAAEASGIGYSTFNEWMQAGEDGRSDKFKDVTNFVEFAAYIKSCVALGMEENLQNIKDASRNGQWPASAWLLERRHPSEFGRKDRMELKNEHSGAVKIVELKTEDCGSDE